VARITQQPAGVARDRQLLAEFPQPVDLLGMDVSRATDVSAEKPGRFELQGVPPLLTAERNIAINAAI